MKILANILRLLMGLLFVFGSLAVLFNLAPKPELTGNAKLYMEGMEATGYLMYLIKITELICGLAFLTGYFVPLASIIISPVIINIFLFQLFVDPSTLPMGIFLVVANIFQAYIHWDKFKLVLKAK